MEWFTVIKSVRGKKFHPTMEKILEEKLITPMSANQIIGILADGIYDINQERKKIGERLLSTRGIPTRLALPHMLKVHPNIKAIPGYTKQKKTYIWED